MSDRVVSYAFRGNFTNLGAGLTTMGKSVNDLGVKLTALDRQGATSRRGLTQLGSTAGKAGLLAAAGVGVVVLAAANFEQAMSNVAATGQDARDNLDALREAAIQAGAATKFSAGEAAAGVENLLKAGVSAKDVLGGGLAGALDLAAAGGLEVADAAEIAATAMTQFKQSGEDVPHIADLLAAAAGKAQGDVSDMAMALKQSGLVASQMGVSIEETTGVLAEFASAGLLGSDAGTSFRTMLLRLANPTAESAKLMDRLGISAYDAQGNFVGIESLAGQLQVAFQGQSQATRDAALATIFGSDAIRAASVLYQGGSQAVADWTDKVNDTGYAADTAAIKMDNLKGDLEQLKGSLETALIGAGGGSQGPLRTLTQGLTSAVNAFNELPPAAQSTVTALGGITAITGGGLWFGSKVISGISNTKQALKDLGVEGGRAVTALKGVGIAAGALATLTVLGTIVDQLQRKFDRAVPGVEALTKSLLDLDTAQSAARLQGQIGSLNDALAEIDPDGLKGLSTQLLEVQESGGSLGNTVKFLEGIRSFGASFVGDSGGELREAKASIDAVDQALANIVATGSADKAREVFEQLADAQGLSADEQKTLLSLLPLYNEALDGSANAATLAADATGDLTSAAQGSATAAEEEAKAIQDATDAMRDKREAALSGFDAETRWREAVKEATKAAKNNDAGIRGNTKGALENRDTLSALAQAWNNQSDAVKNNSARFKDARQTFIDTATAMGVPEQAAKDLAKQLLEIPPKRVTTITTPGIEEATSKANNLFNALFKLHDKTITVKVNQIGGVTSSAGGHSSDPDGRSSGRRSGRTSVGGLDLVTPRGDALATAAAQQATNALKGLANQADKTKDSHEGAAKGLKGLKEQLHDLESSLTKASKAADAAHAALDSLRSQRDELSSSVSGSLEHDAFSGSLSDFETQTAADTADAQAVLAALQTLVTNGLDPHSALFKRLAASGNVALIQQFAALTRDQLAGEAARFAAGQTALGAVGQFAGSQAFNDLIKAQGKVTDRLDGTVRHLAQQVNHLEHAIDQMGDKVKQGAKDGSKEGSREGSEEGTRNGQDERRRRAHVGVRTGG